MASAFGIILVLIGLILRLSWSLQVTIMDTRNATSDLGWPSTPLGWTEVTNTDETEADLRTFQVCRIKQSNQDNWIRTPFLEVGNAERIFVEIRFTIRSCEGISGIVSCKETFNLYYLASDVKDDARAAHTDLVTYTKVDTIAADDRFKPDTIISNTETRIISPLKTKGLYIAFQDTGACMTIMYVRVYYKTCGETLRGLAWFPTTVTGPEMTSLIEVAGMCVENSVESQLGPAPSLHCNGGGQWLVPSGTCQCKPGYQPNDQLTECNECPVGKYKAYDGNWNCGSCPPNSFSIGFGSTSCRCASGFYKAAEDRPEVPCSKPPTKPMSVQFVVNKTLVTITWSEPRDNGGRADITYSVSCERCDFSYSLCSACEEGIDFIPRRSRLTSGRILIRGLSPHTSYKFKIRSFNGVSGASSSRPQYALVRVKTNQAAPSVVPLVRVVSTKAREVVLQWDEPTQTTSPITSYQIQYSGGRGGVRNNSTGKTMFKLSGLAPHTSYIVQVRARSKAGYGLFSRPTAFRTKPDKASSAPVSFDSIEPPSDIDVKTASPQDDATVTRPTQDNEHLIVVIVVICSLLLITIGILLVFCQRKRKYIKASSIDLEKYPGFINQSSVELISTRTYVDPSTYEDPYIAVEEFAKELEYNLIHIEEVIGRGEFGEVCQGRLEPCGQVVAIKTLKAGYNNQEKLDFLSEASIMGQFDHPNVIRLEGVVTRSRPLMIITEYMENGSLDAFLRANEGKLLPLQLARILFDVASGMRYLSGMGYVHRDLAARNVLVNSRHQCKVSDFGLSRFLEEVADEQVAMYTTRGGMIPIRWTAPEAIAQRTFSSSSDVWSYGVVTWEVMSFGERPYWEMPNQEVVHLVESGYRLPAPCYCPRVFHKMMLECWNRDLTRRPTFTELVALLGSFIDEPICLQDTINNRPLRDQDDCIPVLLDLSSLGEWLAKMNLFHYKPVMLRHGVATAEQIINLSESELEQMGITLPNDVDTILREAEELRHQLQNIKNKGFAV